MTQKTLHDFESTGVECPVCGREFKSNKAFGPHFRAAHPDKHPAEERVRDSYEGHPKDALLKWYWDDSMTTREISSEYNIPREGLKEVFEMHGVKRRQTGNHAGYCTNFNGYEMWRSHDPDGVERMMKVHRLVAVAEYGVDAVKGKVVHHKNGLRWDNRPENLEPMEERKHLQQHYNDREIDENGRFV